MLGTDWYGRPIVMKRTYAYDTNRFRRGSTQGPKRMRLDPAQQAAYDQAQRMKYSWNRTGTGYKAPSAVIVQAPSLKGMDTNIGTLGALVLATTNTNGQILPLNLIQPGTASYNRIGRKVKLRSVRLEGTIEWRYTDNASGLYGGNVLRYTLVWDKQPSGAIPTFADIFGQTSQNATETAAWNDHLRFDNTERFTVIRDKKIVCNPMSNPQSTGAGADFVFQRKTFKAYVKLPEMCITNFSGQSSPCTISDISSGALYIIYRAFKNDSDNAFEVITSHARLRYVDQQ